MDYLTVIIMNQTNLGDSKKKAAQLVGLHLLDRILSLLVNFESNDK